MLTALKIGTGKSSAISRLYSITSLACPIHHGKTDGEGNDRVIIHLPSLCGQQTILWLILFSGIAVFCGIDCCYVLESFFLFSL